MYKNLLFKRKFCIFAFNLNFNKMIDVNLFKSLHKKGLNDVQISKIMNTSTTSIGKLRNSLNLPKMLLIDRLKDDIIKLSNQNLSNSEISRILNVSQPSISLIKKELGLKPIYQKTLFKSIEDRIKGRMLVRSRGRAKKLNIDFNITVEDIILIDYCPILGLELDYIYKKHNNIKAASLDRFDNSKGYVKGNVYIISVLANTMKNNASLEQLLMFSKNIQVMIQNHFESQNKDMLQA